MPLSRYLVRNEYGLADPDLYKAAEKDDPEALLEGVAMAGLVGVLRQLGDLAEFAAEMFHDLHEEVMATAARGHALIARVQQLEAELPSAENTLFSQTTHIPFLYNSGIDWHPNIRMDENLVTQGDMPRFVMDSYEECRGPPRLFLLDKFDVAGAGACLKRYTDPSFCKVESADFTIKNSEGQREKRTRKIKRRGSTWRNGDTPEVFPSSHAKLHQLLLEERIETGANDPERRVKLKKRPLDVFTREDRLKSYMQKFMDTYSSDTKAVREISLDLVPVNVEPYNDNCHSGLEIVKYDTFSPSPEPFYKDKAAYSSCNIPEVVKPSLSEYNEVTDNGADADNLTDVTDEDLAADTCSKSRGSVGEYNVDDIASEIDNYVDALATLESETETDSDTKTKSHRWSLNGVKKMIDSDGNEDKQQENLFLDYHSRGNSTISDDCSLLKKETDIFSSSDNVSNSAEDAKVNSSVTREAQVNNIEEYVASDVTENMGVVNAEFKELPWISVNVGSALTKTDTVIEQTDQESIVQAVVNVIPDDGYDLSTPVGISPLDEMADASSDSSSHVSLGHSLITDETSSHPVEATSDALIASVSVPDFPEPVYTPCEDNDLSEINEKSSDDHDQPKHDDSELVEPRVLIPADSEDSCVPPVEPLYFGYIESNEQLEFNSSENSVSDSADESDVSSDWIIHEPTVDKTNMEALSKSDSVDKVESHLSLVSSSNADLVYDTSEAIQSEQNNISFVDITHEKNAEAAISSQTITAEYPSEHITEAKNELDFNHYVQTNVSSASYDCLEVQNTNGTITGYDMDLQNPESCETDVFVTSDLTANDTSSVVLGSGDNAHETCVDDSQTSVEMQGDEITEKPFNALNETSQPLEYAEKIVHTESNPQSLTADLSIQSNDHKVESQLVEVESSALSSSESAADSSIRYQNMNLSQVGPPLFGISPNPSHVAPGDMPPLPPLPPIQWRLGRNQQASLALGGLMQNPFGTLQSSLEPETSDNGGLRYQNISRAQHLDPFLSSSSEGANLQHAVQYSGGYLHQPTDDQHHTITQIFTASENNFTVSDSDKQLNNFSFEPLESGLMTDDATSSTPALLEEVIQKETTVAHDQFEHNVSIVDEQLEHNAEIATTSKSMQYGNQLAHGFSDPEAQGIWSTDVFSARKPENGNGYLQKKIQRPRNPLIDAVVAVDKSKLRKVGEIVKPQDKPEAATREQNLLQLRKVGKRVNKPESETREQVLPQLRKVVQRVKPQDTVKAEGSSQNFPQLRKTVERVKNQGLPSGENSAQQLPQLRKTVERVKSQDLPSDERSSAQQLPQLRKVEKRTKSQDEQKVQDEAQSSFPLRGVGGVGEKLKPQEESQVENKDWLEQIRNQSFNLKRAATSRPNIQGRQTNLKVAAILEKASMIRQAMAGNDDDSDGWSDC